MPDERDRRVECCLLKSFPVRIGERDPKHINVPGLFLITGVVFGFLLLLSRCARLFIFGIRRFTCTSLRLGLKPTAVTTPAAVT